MPVLALKNDSPLGSFAGGLPETTKRWFKGEEREVSQTTADYLTSTFPDVFEVVGGGVVAEAVDSPAVDKSIKSPAKKKTTTRKKSTTKKATK